VGGRVRYVLSVLPSAEIQMNKARWMCDDSVASTVFLQTQIFLGI
jgi:hypothetical protein